MATLSKTIIDVATGEEITLPFTETEIAAHLAEQKRMADEEAVLLAEEKAKANAKKILLEKLGITEDEAKLLLG